MLDFLVIKDGVVDNIIVADSLEIATEVTGLTCIEADNINDRPHIGWLFDGENFEKKPLKKV